MILALQQMAVIETSPDVGRVTITEMMTRLVDVVVVIVVYLAVFPIERLFDVILEQDEGRNGEEAAESGDEDDDDDGGFGGGRG